DEVVVAAGPAGGASSYFDGHLAVIAVAVKPCGDNFPVSTTSALSLNVSGGGPEYTALITLPLRCRSNFQFSLSSVPRMEPGTTLPWTCIVLPSHSWGDATTSSTYL